MTKIDIISGFLGAGKTTLIKKLISEGFNGEKLVLIENEFGQVGIDGGFLKEANIEITEMNSGCICCSLVGDFGKALKRVMSEYSPERIIIEPSGVGKLSDVIKAVQNVTTEVDMQLNSIVAVVDVMKCKMYMKNFGEFFNNQIESARTIVLSRTQKVSKEKLEECLKLIKEHNSKATIVTTDWDKISGEKLLEALETPNLLEKQLIELQKQINTSTQPRDEDKDGCHNHQEHGHRDCCHNHQEHGHKDCCHNHQEHEHGEHHEGHHHGDEVFTSWGIETAHIFSDSELENILKRLCQSEEYGIILRAKGIVQKSEGRWCCFDLVPLEYEIREEGADYTGRLCVIGTKLNKEKLKELFEQA